MVGSIMGGERTVGMEARVGMITGGYGKATYWGKFRFHRLVLDVEVVCLHTYSFAFTLLSLTTRAYKGHVFSIVT
jgi:hypothetical protein